MITRALLATSAVLLIANTASADALSKRKLTEILKDKEVASNPERLLHAIGSQDLSLTRGELIGALGDAGAPRQARHLLSVAETLESKDGRVKFDRLLANGVETPDGRIMAFQSELTYWVEGRDLVGVRGLYAAKDARSGMERLRVVRNAIPKPAPAPEPATPPLETLPLETPDGPTGGPLPPPALPPVTTSVGPPGSLTPPVAPAPASAAETPAETPDAPPVATTAPGSIGIAGALRRELGPDSQGDEVRAIQEQLNRHLPENDAPLEEDGSYGPRTKQAVTDFQAIHGLPQTGVIDSATREALESAKLLGKGDKGAGVSEVQRLLNAQRGDKPALDEDEDFGARTEQGVKDFQAAQGLPQTGTVDAATLTALRRAARAATPAQPEPAQPTVSAASLERGQESDAVQDLQQELNRHRRAAGLAPIKEDGKFGAGTERAVQEFQEAKGLDSTGRADVGTAAELSKEVVRPSVSRGDEGPGVQALQESLNAHRRAAGWAPIKEDGKFGAGTERAVKEFQRAKGLPTSGALDSATGSALETTPEQAPALKRGDESEQVRELQQDLNKHRRAKGERAISEDGKFGAGTEQALKDFQNDAGISPTGEADGATQSAAQAAPDTSQDAINASPAELEILARIVKGECPANVPWEGKVAVAAVVLNRVRSRRFPNSIRRVAHQPKQFSCYNANVRRRLYLGRIPDYAWRAARAALAGQDPSRGATYYFNPFLVNPGWKRSLTFVRRITNRSAARKTTHDFYRDRR